MTEIVETTDHNHTARGFLTGSPTIIEAEQRANVGVENILNAAVKALENEFGPAPVGLSFQEIVYLACKT